MGEERKEKEKKRKEKKRKEKKRKKHKPLLERREKPERASPPWVHFFCLTCECFLWFANEVVVHKQEKRKEKK